MFSFVIPVFNRHTHLDEAIDSILNQADAGEVEIILVDDFSTDALMRAFLADLPARHPAVQVLQNRGKKGPGGARNTGIATAKGEWIGFLDSDDVLTATAMETFRFLTSQPGAAWVAGGMVDWWPDGRKIAMDGHEVSDSEMQPALRANAVPDLINGLIFTTLVNAGSTLIRAELLRDTAGFHEDLFIGEDWYLWMRLAMRAELLTTERVVLQRRRGDDSIMQGSRLLGPDRYRYLLLARRDPVFRFCRRQLRWRLVHLLNRLADDNRSVGQRWQARGYSLLATFWSPVDRQQWRRLLDHLR